MTLHEQIYAQFDEFNMEVVGAEEKKQAKALIETLIQTLPPDERDAEDYYIWGQIYYCQDTDKPQHTAIALTKFQQSVALDPAHDMSRLYTAHCLHDQGNYAEALCHYLQVNQEQLRADYHIWRYVKLREQIGFCLYQTGKTTEAETYFKEVLDWSHQLDPDEIASPYELLSCLPTDHPIVVAIKQSKGYW